MTEQDFEYDAIVAQGLELLATPMLEEDSLVKIQLSIRDAFPIKSVIGKFHQVRFKHLHMLNAKYSELHYEDELSNLYSEFNRAITEEPKKTVGLELSARRVNTVGQMLLTGKMGFGSLSFITDSGKPALPHYLVLCEEFEKAGGKVDAQILESIRERSKKGEVK